MRGAPIASGDAGPRRRNLKRQIHGVPKETRQMDVLGQWYYRRWSPWPWKLVTWSFCGLARIRELKSCSLRREWE